MQVSWRAFVIVYSYCEQLFCDLQICVPLSHPRFIAIHFRMTVPCDLSSCLFSLSPPKHFRFILNASRGTSTADFDTIVATIVARMMDEKKRMWMMIETSGTKNWFSKRETSKAWSIEISSSYVSIFSFVIFYPGINRILSICWYFLKNYLSAFPVLVLGKSRCLLLYRGKRGSRK